MIEPIISSPAPARGQAGNSLASLSGPLQDRALPYVNAWCERLPNFRVGAQISERFIELLKRTSFVEEENGLHTIVPFLPDFRSRPLLAAAVVQELIDSGLDSAALAKGRAEVTRHSEILQLLRLPYRPIYLADIAEAFACRKGSAGSLDHLTQDVLNGQGINSTLRNILIAHRINESLFRQRPLEATLVVARYSWQDRQSATMPFFGLPDLPKRYYLKAMIGIDEQGASFGNEAALLNADYGMGPGQERYGILPTGEHDRIVGLHFPNGA